MAKQTLENYKSRRNRAELIQADGRRFVIKTFFDEAAFQKELQIYQLLRDTDLPCAKVIQVENKALVLTELPGRNLVECLESQEQTAQPIWDVWEKLVAWLIAFTRHTGFVMTDVNLRNFLYDEKTKTLYGLDFEECDACDIARPAARLAAYIRTYQPQHTPLKQKISQYVLDLFARDCCLDADELFRASIQQETALLERRTTK